MKKKIYQTITMAMMMAAGIATTALSQITHPSVSINQNGHFNINKTLTGAIFEMVITNYCPEVHNLHFVYNDTDMEFLGGVDPELYTKEGAFIFLHKEKKEAECDSYTCEPMQLAFRFRFKPGQCQSGPLSGFGYSYSHDCYEGSVLPPFPLFKFITAVANNCWKLKVNERAPSQFLPPYEKEWELMYFQDFDGAPEINGIPTKYGIGTLDLEIENVNVNLAVSSCTDPDYEFTGYTGRYYFNGSIPNVPYTAFAGGPNMDGSFDYTPDSGYTHLSSVDSIFKERYFFVKGQIIICDEEEECNYRSYFTVDGELGDGCGITTLTDSMSGTAGYEQIVLESLGSLTKTISVGAYQHLAPGCTGLYTISFQNKSLTDITTLQITDHFPPLLNYNIGDISTFPSGIFDINTSGGDIVFDLLTPHTISSAQTVFITIPFSVSGAAIPGTLVSNSADAIFNAVFPTDTVYDQCGNLIVINPEPGVAATARSQFNVDEPRPVSGIIKCVDSTGSINVGDEQDFTIYMINNGAQDLNATLTDFFEESNLEIIPGSISYSSKTILSVPHLNCNTSYNLDPGLNPGFSAVFDDEDSWEIEIPANCNYNEYNILGINFTAIQKPAEKGINKAALGTAESTAEYGINRLGQMKIEKFVNSGFGKDDWATEHSFATGIVFQYKIEVSNTGSVGFNGRIVIEDELPECADLISVSASINGSPVTVGGTAPYFEFAEELAPGQTLELIITAEYLGEGEEDCINTACAVATTSLSENFLSSCSNEASIIDPCTLVDINIEGSFVLQKSSASLCCFRLSYLNMFPQPNAFTHIGYQFDESIQVLSHDDFLQSFSGGFVLYRPSPSGPVPNNTAFSSFIEICFLPEDLPQVVDFHWFNSGNIICTSPVEFKLCKTILEKRDGLEAYPEGLEVSVYPNPSTSLLNIQINQQEERGNIILYGAEGKIVYDSTVAFYSRTAALDISSLADGLYMLQLTLASGATQMVKFVKMN